ncbi:MAG: Hsp20/alpha crystallin family protein [Planctomycetota bacterium]
MNKLTVHKPEDRLMHEMWHEIDHMMGHPNQDRDEFDFHPPVDIRSSAGGLEVTFDIPGVRKEDLLIEVEDGHLVVKGEKSAPALDKEGRYVSTERQFGRFHRVVHLPEDMKPDKVAADFHDGALTVIIPRVAAVRPEVKKIEVT